MTRRAIEAVGIVDAPRQQRVQSFEATAGRELRDLVAAGADRRELAGIAAHARAQGLNAADVVAGVVAGQLLQLGAAGLEANQIVQDACNLQQSDQAPLRLRALRVAVRLVDQSVGQGAGAGARVVPEVVLVAHKTCTIHAFRLHWNVRKPAWEFAVDRSRSRLMRAWM
jgi:hypothetical protein